MYSFCVFLCLTCVFFFKQKTAYEMRISDWSSDVCSSDLNIAQQRRCRRKKQINLTPHQVGDGWGGALIRNMSQREVCKFLQEFTSHVLLSTYAWRAVRDRKSVV